MNKRFLQMIEMMRSSHEIIDLGCGATPVSGATVAVDLYVDPKERSLGHGAQINEEEFRRRGIKFVNTRIDAPLPFPDKEFDFAYSHHAFEHLDDPATACNEMMRIANAGVIITPSIFAEIAFGRQYHRWLIIERNNTLFFFSKRLEEDRPFGEHPEYDLEKGWVATEKTNPFDIAFNDGEWNRANVGKEFSKLSQRLRDLWNSHSSLIEVIFLWQDSFDYQVLCEPQ
jgi:SAM-dependent methyltransferase